MSQNCVILRYQAPSQPDSRSVLINNVTTLLKQQKLRVTTLQPLPYRSSQTKNHFRVPEDLLKKESELVFYFYYMANERNNQVARIQDHLGSITALQVFENSSFRSVNCSKRTLEELEQDCDSLRLENLELKKKLFISDKKVQVLQGTCENFMEHNPGGCKSLSTQQPFLLTPEAVALRGTCAHYLQRSDLIGLKNNLYCLQCQNTEKFTFHEDWGLTTVSNGLYLSELVEKNSSSLFHLNEMKQTGKLHKVQQFEIEPVKKNDETILITKAIYDTLHSPPHSPLKPELLPLFTNEDTDPFSMDSALLNSLLGMNKTDFKAYLKEKESQIPGASNWEVKEYCGNFKPSPTIPVADQGLSNAHTRVEEMLYHEYQEPLEHKIRQLKNEIIGQPTRVQNEQLYFLEEQLNRAKRRIASHMAGLIIVD
jgi:hypothetical protein